MRTGRLTWCASRTHEGRRPPLPRMHTKTTLPPSLHPVWRFTPAGASAFTGAPQVHEGLRPRQAHPRAVGERAAPAVLGREGGHPRHGLPARERHRHVGARGHRRARGNLWTSSPRPSHHPLPLPILPRPPTLPTIPCRSIWTSSPRRCSRCPSTSATRSASTTAARGWGYTSLADCMFHQLIAC